MKSSSIALGLLLVLTTRGSNAQETPVPELSTLIKANEAFGRRLLLELHNSALDKNVVISPLGVTVSFAPIRYAAHDFETVKEINAVFGWDRIERLDLSSKMLLARFDAGSTQISTRFLFRKGAPVSKEYVKMISKNFAIKTQTVESGAPQEQILSPRQERPAPKVAGESKNNFWIVNTTALDAEWSGNTFAMGQTKISPFTAGSGVLRQSPMLVSELSSYDHLKTPELEAIRLNCLGAYILIVLPGPGKDIRDLENSLTNGQTLLAHDFPREIGDVELPEFHLQNEVDLRAMLQSMGVHRVFTNLESLRNLSQQGAALLGFSQQVDMKLDRQGIHAHAFTVEGGIAGGIMVGTTAPFHMIVNRPFLFFIHDIYTDSLLFAGVVTDPNKN